MSQSDEILGSRPGSRSSCRRSPRTMIPALLLDPSRRRIKAKPSCEREVLCLITTAFLADRRSSIAIVLSVYDYLIYPSILGLGKVHDCCYEHQTAPTIPSPSNHPREHLVTSDIDCLTASSAVVLVIISSARSINLDCRFTAFGLRLV